jgi:hypothetical protein
MSRLSSIPPIARQVALAGTILALLTAITWPLLFTYSGFAGDWEHHLWLMWHESLAMQEKGFPSLFLNSEYSVFYPTFAFYGGTVYAVGSLLSLAIGGAPVSAYVLVYVLDFAAAFAGWYWMARMARVDRWLAIVPGLVFVTSSYYLSVVYVQGDWPEFTGISMISLMTASALSVLRAPRLRFGPALALAVSTLLFFGSHNITILLGLTTLALTTLALLVFVPDARHVVTRRGLMRVGCLVVPAALVSAWYLLPALAYQSDTHIGSNFQEAAEGIDSSPALVSLARMFTFSRTAGAAIPAPYYLSLSLPVLAVAWVLAGIFVSRRSRSRSWWRVLLVCAGVSVLITLFMTHSALILALPRQYSLMEFTYRLETYVLLTISAAVLAALAAARGRTRSVTAWRWMLVPVCLASLVGAVWQLQSYVYPGQDRYQVLDYYGQVETGNNRDYQTVGRVIPGHDLASVQIPVQAIHDDDHASLSTREPPGTLLATNIGAGPYLLHVTGAKAVGVDSETGDMVLEVGPSTSGAGAGASDASSTSTEHLISVSTGHNLPIVLGRVLTLGALAVLALELLVIGVLSFNRAPLAAPFIRDTHAQLPSE